MKMGTRQGEIHFMMPEEAIYLSELGVAGILTDPNSSELLSLNQLFSLLPLFNLTLFRYCAFRSLIKANYRVQHPPDEL